MGLFQELFWSVAEPGPAWMHEIAKRRDQVINQILLDEFDGRGGYAVPTLSQGLVRIWVYDSPKRGKALFEIVHAHEPGATIYRCRYEAAHPT